MALLLAAPASAVIHNIRGGEAACMKEDVARRVQLQNKLAGACEEMCKEVGAYPHCTGCPNFVAPDATPGVMTWDELLERLDGLKDAGRGMLKEWHQKTR